MASNCFRENALSVMIETFRKATRRKQFLMSLFPSAAISSACLTSYLYSSRANLSLAIASILSVIAEISFDVVFVAGFQA